MKAGLLERGEMHSTKKIIVLIAALLLGSGGAVAQETQPPLSGRIFNEGEIVVESKVYQGERVTSVEIEPTFIEFSERKKISLYLTASFMYSGASPATSNFITLAFYSKSPSCKFPQSVDFNLVLEIDGGRNTINSNLENIKRGSGAASAFSEMEGDICNESLVAYLPQQVFLQFKEAKQVKVRFGSMSFQLKENNLAALRNLASRMMSAKTQSKNSLDRSGISLVVVENWDAIRRYFPPGQSRR